MFPLIRKELINLYNLTFFFVITVMSILILKSNYPPIESMVIITFLVAFKNLENDRKVNIDMILNSLPVSRLNIIVSKYISFYLFLLMVITLFTLLSTILTKIQLPFEFHDLNLNSKHFIVALMVWSVYMAFYIPISTIFKAQVIQYICFFIFLLGIPYLFNLFVQTDLYPTVWLLEQSFGNLIAPFLICLGINVLSCFLLYRYYRKKDII
jgi:ABC-2 type transport system permease protein